MKKEDLKINTGWLNVNTECNNLCAWCYRTADLNLAPQRMNFDVAEELVDFFIELGIFSLIFIGGEPTLYPNLHRLIYRARNGGIPEITVVTNGRILKNKKLVQRYIDSGISVFSVSIHSASPEIHNISSRTSSWAETIKGIGNIVSLGGKCSLNVIAGKQNVDNIPESLPKLLDLGVDGIIVSCAIPYICGKKVVGENALDPNRFSELIEEIVPLSEKIVVLHELPLCLINKETFLNLARKNRLGYGCHIGVGRGLSIDVDGSIIPCNSFPHMPLLNLVKDGKLQYSTDEFLKLWQSNKMIVDLRNQANVMRSPICLNCNLWSLCNCGCPLTWGYFSPKNYINDGLKGINAGMISDWAVKKYNP